MDTASHTAVALNIPIPQPAIDPQAAAHPLFSDMSPSLRAKMLAYGRAVWVRPGRPVVQPEEPADSVFLVLDGALRLSLPNATGEVLSQLVSAPGIVGLREVIAGGGESPFACQVLALTPCRLWKLPADVFLKCLRIDRSLAGAVMKRLADEANELATQHKMAALESVDSRVMQVLMAYGRHLGDRVAAGTRITFRISQNSLGQDLGVSRMSVVRSLKKLTDAGLVLRKAGRYVIIDPPAMPKQVARC